MFSTSLGDDWLFDEKTLVFLRERIIGFGQSRVGRDAAEDLAQEALLLLSTKYAHLERLSDLMSVAFKIMANKALDMVGSKTWTAERTKSDPVDLPLPSVEPSPYERIEAKEEARRTTERMAATFQLLGPSAAGLCASVTQANRRRRSRPSWVSKTRRQPTCKSNVATIAGVD